MQYKRTGSRYTVLKDDSEDWVEDVNQPKEEKGTGTLLNRITMWTWEILVGIYNFLRNLYKEERMGKEGSQKVAQIAKQKEKKKVQKFTSRQRAKQKHDMGKAVTHKDYVSISCSSNFTNIKIDMSRMPIIVAGGAVETNLTGIDVERSTNGVVLILDQGKAEKVQITANHVKFADDYQMGLPLNEHIKQLGISGKKMKAKVKAYVENISQPILITIDQQKKKLMIEVRQICAIKRSDADKGITDNYYVGYLMQAPRYDNVIYSGSTLIKNDAIYIVTVGLVDKERDIVVLYCHTIEHCKTKVSLNSHADQREDQGNESESEAQENDVGLIEPTETIDPTSSTMAINKNEDDVARQIEQEVVEGVIGAKLMTCVYSNSSYQTVYVHNLSSMPWPHLEPYLIDEMKKRGKKIKEFKRARLGPSPTDLISMNNIAATRRRTSIIVFDKDDRNRFRKEKTLTHGELKYATIIVLESSDEKQEGSTYPSIVPALDYHAPRGLSMKTGIPHIGRMLTEINGKTLHYNKTADKWSAGTDGIRIYCAANKIPISVTELVAAKEEGTWIEIGKSIKNARIKDLRNVPACDFSPDSDLEYCYRAGATDYIQTHKGPLHYTEVYEFSENKVTSEKDYIRDIYSRVISFLAGMWKRLIKLFKNE